MRITSESLLWPPRPSMGLVPGSVQPQPPPPPTSHSALHQAGPFVSPECTQVTPALEPLYLLSSLPGCRPDKLCAGSCFLPGKLKQCRGLSGPLDRKWPHADPSLHILLPALSPEPSSTPPYPSLDPGRLTPPKACTAWLRCLWVLPTRSESLGQAGCFFPASPCISISIPYLPVRSSCQVAPLQGFQQYYFLPLIQHPRSWPDGPILH